jgi:PTS system nitrogen regulatory IIA component
MPVLRLSDYLREDLVLTDLPRLAKTEFLAVFAAAVVERVEGLEAPDLLERLLAREAQQSTGIGGGLALPHAIVPGLARTLLAVGLVEGGIEFDASDSHPADLFFVLLSPPESAAEHLRVLARLARILDVPSTLGRLRAAENPNALHRLLLAEDARHVY